MNTFTLSGTVTAVRPDNYKEDKYLYRVEVRDENGIEVPVTLFTEVKQGQQVTIEGRLGGWRNDNGRLFLQFDYTELKGGQSTAPQPSEQTSAF